MLNLRTSDGSHTLLTPRTVVNATEGKSTNMGATRRPGGFVSTHDTCDERESNWNPVDG